MYSVFVRKKLRQVVVWLTLLMLWVQAGILAPPAYAETPGQTPVSQQVYAYRDMTPAQADYIFANYLKKSNLMSGFPDGTFRPLAGLSRAEAATVLVKAARLTTGTAKTGFKDVNTKHWAAKYIAAAKNAGLISGYRDGTFRPNAPLTRAEGITLVLKLSKQADSGVELPTISDVTPRHWAARAIATGLAAEMVSLSSDNKHFLPDKSFSRSALARSLVILLTRDSGLYQTALPNTLMVTAGTVRIVRAKNGASESIDSTTTLNVGDAVYTDQTSSANLEFPDGTGIRLEPNSEITVKESRGRSYIKSDGSPGIAVEWLNINMDQGKIFGALATSAEVYGTSQEPKAASTMVRAASLRSSKVRTAAAGKPLPWWQQSGVKRTKVKVDMPTGVAAIRGTFWHNTVSTNGSCATTLLTGQAVVTSGGQTVSVAAGQSTTITSVTAPPAPPAPLSPAEMSEWVQAASWAQQQAAMIVQNQAPPLPPPPPAEQLIPVPGPITPAPTPVPIPAPTSTPAPIQVLDITQTIFIALTNVGATNLAPPSAPIPPSIFTPPPAVTQTTSVDTAVTSIPVSFLALNTAQIDLQYGGDPYILIPFIAPSDATNKNVTWTSSDPKVANVVNGVVIPLSPGTAKITATTTDGGKQAACTVTVTQLVVK